MSQSQERLVHALSDVYSMERQALAQLRKAPDIAGEPGLAADFRTHHLETERQAERVEERLVAHGGSPSRIKDAVMELGGKGFLLFARAQPDTPGKLTAHAYSYEAMEWAAYEMLGRLAESAGDTATVAVAHAIRDEERAMMERLESRFDAAVAASLAASETRDLDSALRSYLADAHAIEEQSIQLLERGPDLAGDATTAEIYRRHLDETRGQARRVEQRLEALGGDPSSLKDAALRAGGLNWSLFFQAQPDTSTKLAVFAYAVEHLEIAGYELLRRVAERAGDGATARLAADIAAEERAMAERLAGAFDRAAGVTSATVAV